MGFWCINVGYPRLQDKIYLIQLLHYDILCSKSKNENLNAIDIYRPDRQKR